MVSLLNLKPILLCSKKNQYYDQLLISLIFKILNKTMHIYVLFRLIS